MQPSYAQQAGCLARLCRLRLHGLRSALVVPPSPVQRPSCGLRCRGVQTRAGPGQGPAFEKSTNLEDLRTTFAAVAKLGAAAYVIQVYFFNSTMCIGPSMLPTFNARGDVLLTEYISPRLNLLKAGDVIVATKPNDSKTSVIKRIRGMSGDKIWVRRQGGASLPEEVVVPEGHVWLEGDNPLQSTDSRDYGPVPLALVRGRIVLRFWPPTQAQMIRSRVIDHTQPYRDGKDAMPARPVAAPASSPSYHVRSRVPSPHSPSAIPAAQATASGPLSVEGHPSPSLTDTTLVARPEN